MKKILLMVFAICLCLSGFSQIKLEITPTKPIGGIKKESSSYTTQDFVNEQSDFFLGHDTKRDTHGRGYLQFDLRSIPLKANITSVSLKLRTVSYGESNYGGTIILKQCGAIQKAGEFEWITLDGPGPILARQNVSTSGQSISLSGPLLKSAVESEKGRSLYLSLLNEVPSKIIRYSGGIINLYLEVIYTEGDGSSGGSTGSSFKILEAPLNQYSGDELTLGYAGTSAYTVKKWEYDPNEFSEIRRTSWTITLVPKTKKWSQRVTVKMTAEYKDLYIIKHRQIAEWSFPVYGRPYIVPSSYCECEGGTVRYNIENISGAIGNGRTVWMSNSPNMTLISSNDMSATYRVSGNQACSVSARVEQSSDKGHRTFDIDNNQVWVGKPNVDITGPSRLNYNSTHTFYVSNLAGGTQYSWRLIGNGVFTNGTNRISTTVPQVEVRTGSDPEPGTGSLFKIYCDITNKCGTSSGTRQFMFVMGGLRSASTIISDVTDNKYENTTYSIRIYDISGKMVYTNSKVTGELDLRSTSLYDGIYIIEKYDGKNVTRDKVMLKR
ncbi:MAG TPA: hypothetical protein DIT04_04395 [Dysgonomonas sp.]|nr:hypothetical protein [Dysgonomonas sp.]